jgi:hypothetical protein
MEREREREILRLTAAVNNERMSRRSPPTRDKRRNDEAITDCHEVESI